MVKNYNIAVIGGDERQYYLYKELQKSFNNISLFNLEKFNKKYKPFSDLDSYNTIIFPMPFSKNKLTVFTPLSNYEIEFNAFKNLKNKTIIGGMFCKEFLIICQNNNKIFDISNNENLIMNNAILTAEAGISLAVSNSKNSFLDSNVLIIGNGRIGKSLAHILTNFYANIYVSARNQIDFNCIKANGLNFINTYNLGESLNKFDYIFNTVPSLVLNKNNLNNCKTDCLIVDLASAPGGVDYEYCKNKNINAIKALSLPGKFSPKAAAKHLNNTVKEIILQS